MKATRVLPESYSLYHHFDVTKYKKATWVVIVLGLLVFVASFTFLNNLARTLRPEYQPVERLHFELTLERLIVVLRLLVPMAVIAIVHEGIHASCLWLFTHERPTFVATFEGVGGIGVRLPSWYFSRNAFLVANLAPVFSMTLAGLLLLPIVAHRGIGLLVFGLSLNLAGSTTDVISSIYVCLLPASVYVTTDGEIHLSQVGDGDPKWKRWLRSGMKWILARLEGANGEG